MKELPDFLKNKKNLVSLLILLILILAIPLGINLVKTQQIIKSRATSDPIVFTGESVVDLPGGKKGFKLNTEGKAIVKLELTSTLGPPPPSASQSSSAN